MWRDTRFGASTIAIKSPDRVNRALLLYVRNWVCD